MTDDEILTVVQAHKEGKQIEHRPHVDNEWQWQDLDKNTPMWQFASIEYRVKPKAASYLTPFGEAENDASKLDQSASTTAEPSTKSESLPRKPREWDAAVSMDGKLRVGIIDLHALDCERIRVREVIEE